MSLTIIACVDNDSLLGLKDGRLAYRFKEDMRFFSEYTAGKTVITSRKTFDTISNQLPGRNIIAFSNNRHSIRKNFDGKYWLFKQSLKEVLSLVELSAKEFVVIGGAEIYRQAMPFCSKAIITKPTYVGHLTRKFNYVPPGMAVRFPEKEFRQQFETESRPSLVLKRTELFTIHQWNQTSDRLL